MGGGEGGGERGINIGGIGGGQRGNQLGGPPPQAGGFGGQWGGQPAPKDGDETRKSRPT